MIYQTGEMFQTISRHLKVIHQTLTRSSFTSDIKTRKGKIQNTRECVKLYRVFSHDVTAAILVSQNNETAAILVSQTNPVGVELFSCANAFFCSDKFA